MSVLFAAEALLICFIALYSVSHADADWDYKGMRFWSLSYPDCGEVDESPINVDTEAVFHDAETCTAEFDWDIKYEHETFAVVNNGHALQLIATKIDKYHDYVYRRRLGRKIEQYEILNTGFNTIATLPNYFGSDSEHSKYCLESFHMHWGMSSDYGSEHTLDGKHLPLEMHFVHFACDDTTIGNALDSYQSEPDPYVLAVVAVFVEISETDNPAFEAILTDKVLQQVKMPDDANTAEAVEGVAVIHNLDLAQLIPSDIGTAGYYAYEGSLTTPPCTDVVRWHLMKAKATISEAQLNKLRTLLNAEGGPLAPNYRDIQSNVNGVWDCSDEDSEDQEGDKESARFVRDHVVGAARSGEDSFARDLSTFLLFVGMLLFVGFACIAIQYMNSKETEAARKEVEYMDTCVSDQDINEPESDALIHQ